MSRIVASLLVAALVVLAGCTGAISGPGDAQAADSSTVAFYVSDERNAIEQFSHLNVTVTEVAFAGGNASANASVDANATERVNGTDGDANATASATAGADAAADAGLVTRDVGDRTVDLTALQGANATLLGNVSVPAGEYEQVFVRVSGVEGTLESGESVNVKLPSDRLRVDERFEANGAASVDFVFDITVVEAGNSGKFVLKPVASESGTDVPIEVVDETAVAVNASAGLDVSVLGDAAAGENATVKVTKRGDAVADAELRADDGVVATTNANGTAVVRVPADGELELEATADTAAEGEALLEGELELGLGGGDGADGGESESADDGADGVNDTDGDATNGDDTNDGDATNGDDVDDSDDADGDAGGAASADLAVALDGSLTADERVTVVVTDGDGDAVENATVAVDGAAVGETNADGELAFDVPTTVGVGSSLTVTADGDSVTLDAGTVAAAN